MTDTATTETVTIPKDLIGPIIRTYLHAYGRDKDAVEPEAAEAVRTVFDLAGTDDTDTVTLDATTAWILAHHADVLFTYNLDEADEATYAHPAVVAEETLQRLVADQAPETNARLDAEIEAKIAAGYADNSGS